MVIRELSWRKEEFPMYIHSTPILKPEIYNTELDDTQSVKLSDSVIIGKSESDLSSEPVKYPPGYQPHVGLNLRPSSTRWTSKYT